MTHNAELSRNDDASDPLGLHRETNSVYIGPSCPAGCCGCRFIFTTQSGALELEAEDHLHDARIERAGHLAEVAGSVVGRDGREVGMVEHVEKFAAELECAVLADVEVLVERHIEIHQSWSANDARTRVAEITRRGSGECVAVEPLIHGFRSAQGGTGEIGADGQTLPGD